MLEEGCGHTAAVRLHLSGCWPWGGGPRGSGPGWSIRCPGAEPGVVLGPLVVLGSVRGCATADKTFKGAWSKSKWFEYLMAYIWLRFTFIFYS